MKVRGISSNTGININTGGGNIKAGIVPSVGYMRKANTSVIFRMKAHEKKIKIISVLTNGEENYFLDKLNEEYTKLATNYVNNTSGVDTVEQLYRQENLRPISNEFLKQSFRTIKQQFKNHLIQGDDIEIDNTNGDQIIIKTGFEFKRIGYNYKKK